MVDCPESRRVTVALYGRKNISRHDLALQMALKNVIFRQNLKDHEELLGDIKAALGRVLFIARYLSTQTIEELIQLGGLIHSKSLLRTQENIDVELESEY